MYFLYAGMCLGISTAPVLNRTKTLASGLS